MMTMMSKNAEVAVMIRLLSDLHSSWLLVTVCICTSTGRAGSILRLTLAVLEPPSAASRCWSHGWISPLTTYRRQRYSSVIIITISSSSSSTVANRRFLSVRHAATWPLVVCTGRAGPDPTGPKHLGPYGQQLVTNKLQYLKYKSYCWTPKIPDGGDLPSWKSTWHFSAMGGPIWIKFRRLVQNDMPTAVIRLKPKPEVEFQYDGRLFFESGNSCNSATDWVVITKFGLLISTDIWKRATSPDLRPEVKFQYGGRLFFQTGSSYILAVNWDMSIKFGL